MQNKGSYGRSSETVRPLWRCATARAETPLIINNQRSNRCSFLDASHGVFRKARGRVEDGWKTGGRREEVVPLRAPKPCIEAQSCCPAEFPRGTESLPVSRSRGGITILTASLVPMPPTSLVGHKKVPCPA